MSYIYELHFQKDSEVIQKPHIQNVAWRNEALGGVYALEDKLFRLFGILFRINDVGVQHTLGAAGGSVGRHLEPKAELIAPIYGVSNVRIWGNKEERCDTLSGVLRPDQMKKARFAVVEVPNLQPKLLIAHEELPKDVLVPFSITMPGEEHTSIYQPEAAIAVLKMTPEDSESFIMQFDAFSAYVLASRNISHQ